jgi:uncharacterized membrane protein YebE (DUF533 family)
MPRNRALGVAVITGALVAGLVAAGPPAAGQDVDQNGQRTDLPQLRQQLNIPQQVRQHIDTTEMSKTPPLLVNLARALPAFVAGACVLVLLGRLLGIYQMGPTGTLILLVVIAGIVYRLYWHL